MRFAGQWLLGLVALPSLSAEITNGSSFSHLQAHIATTGNVELSGVIEFNQTLTIPDGRIVTIRGASNATTLLDGGGLRRLFVVEGQLRVLNLTISNGRANNGGAFYVFNGALDIVDCTLRGNVADGWGGVVFNNNGTVRFQGGVAHNNTAVRGGVVYNEQGSLHINGGLFHDNAATEAGGVGYNFRGRSTLMVVIFSSNAVTNSDGVGNGGVFCNEEHIGSAKSVIWEHNRARWGGAILNRDSHYEILDSQCMYNQAERGGCFYVANREHITSGGTSSYNLLGLSEGVAWGSAVFNEAPTHFRTTGIACELNRAENGGAFYVVNSTLDIVEGILYGNDADGSGGAVFNTKGTVRFSGGVADSNTAVRGGVVYNEQGSLHIDGGFYHNNTAAQGGGVGYNLRGTSTLTVALFSSNAVTKRHGSGGVFFNEEHTGSAINVTWEHNGASWGGAVFNDGSTYQFLDSRCRYNQAERGGCFYFTKSSHTISGGTYSHNIADRASDGGAWGGAIYDTEPTFFSITGITCESNRADSGGCCAFDLISNDEKKLSISGCRFRNNSAVKNGGSIFINEPDVRLVLSNNHFSDGSGISGGFLYIAQGRKKVIVARGKFMRGSASDRGGAIFTTSKLSLRNSRFTACDAFMGGVLFIGNDVLTQLENVTMIGNHAALFGGAIHNERSSEITSSKETILEGNTADVSGGAIYSQAKYSNIRSTNVPIRLINNRANSGSAVGVQAGVHLQLQEVFSFSNEAVQGAVFVGQRAQLVLNKTVFSHNIAAGEGGALYLQTGAVASIFESTFFNNSANMGGFAYIDHGGSLMSFDSKLKSNRAHSGGAIAASSARIVAKDTKWFTNVGDHGGVFLLTDSQFASAGGCTYRKNRASYGGIANLQAGGELLLNQTDKGVHNSAIGGGVAFYDHRTTAKPPDPPLKVKANATFGPTFATGLSSLRAIHHGKEVNQREFTNPIRFEAYDDLGNAYETPDIETIELVPRQGLLIGTTLLYLQGGNAETRGIRVSYEPDSNVTIVARIAQLDVVTTLNVTLRACYFGEIGDDCTACTDNAKYSLNPSDDICLDCPKHASCISDQAKIPDFKGALLILKAGYWRSGPFSTNIRKCPYAEACKGGVDLWTAEDSCRESHRGPMCTLCKNRGEDKNEQYLLDRSTGKCHKCASKVWVIIAAVLVLSVALVVILPLATLIVLSHDHSLLFTDFLRNTCRSLEQSWIVRTIEEVTPMIKIVFVFSQVVSSEYSTFLFVNYPTMFDKVVVGLSFSQNFAVHSIFTSLCVRINHYSELLSVTLVPIVIIISSELIHLVASSQTSTVHLRKKIRNYTTFIRLITLFIVYSTASIVICTTFRCDDDFRKEDDASRYLKTSYLAVDYSISCRKSVHKIYVTYSALMVFVYPVGVPLYFFCLLWLNRHFINPDAKELADAILSYGPEHTLSIKTENKVEGKSNRALSCADHGAPEKDIRLKAIHYTKAVALYKEHDALKPLTPSLSTLSDGLVASHAALDRKIAHLGFLFCDYSPDCWWFESLECIRRLLLTAIFPVVYSIDNAAGLLYSTFLLSLLFLGIYWATQPFVDEGVNRFAVLMHTALSLILFLTIILYSEERLENADSARWNRQAIGIVLIFLSTCLGPTMVVFQAQLGGFQIYNCCGEGCRHSIMLGDGDKRIAADLDDEEQKDAVKDHVVA